MPPLPLLIIIFYARYPAFRRLRRAPCWAILTPRLRRSAACGSCTDATTDSYNGPRTLPWPDPFIRKPRMSGAPGEATTKFS